MSIASSVADSLTFAFNEGRRRVPLTAAGGFNETQERVAKGNREGGQWIDTAGTIADLLESKAGGLKQASKEYGRKPADGGTWPQLASKSGLYKLPAKSRDAQERREYQEYLASPGINGIARQSKADKVRREESLRRERTRSWEKFNEGYPGSAVDVGEAVEKDIAQWKARDRNQIKNLDGFIDKHGVVSEKDMTVLRGMQSNKDIFDVPSLFAPGKVFVDHGYLSTTFDPATMKLASAPPRAGGQLGFLADLFSVPTEPWTMQIQVPAGTKFVRGEGTQKELLFGRGKKMKVLAMNPDTRELIVEMVP